ncbi:protein POF1B [Carettochelys insculpta]|uniref:protein POF1B n=1 Tax=Carettochelys insculpta TaxID=44489 RepID=UPI003EBADD71
MYCSQQVQPQALPPRVQHHRPQPCYHTLPLPQHRRWLCPEPLPCPEPPPCRPRPCPEPLPSRPRPCPEPLPCRPRPCPEPLPCPDPLPCRPRPCPEPLPCPDQPPCRPRPCPEPLPCPDPPPQQHCDPPPPQCRDPPPPQCRDPPPQQRRDPLPPQCRDPPPQQRRDPPPPQRRDPPPQQRRDPPPQQWWPQPNPEPLPPEPPPQQHLDGNVVYERVRTYSYSGGQQVLEPPQCSSRPVSPLVVWSRDPPQQEPLSPFLRGGNNVIYEKTIRKYELLNPEQEKQYQFSHQSNQSNIIHQCQQCEQHQVNHQCQQSEQHQVNHQCQQSEQQHVNYPCQQSEQQHVNYLCQQSEQQHVNYQCQQRQTSSPCEISSISVTDGGTGKNTVRSVTIQGCKPVQSLQESNNQLDSRYFGELLAEVHRKSNDLYSTLVQHVEKLGRRTKDFESTSQVEDIEDLIPKGLSEFTKQQIRYLLQMRVTSDKSLRLVLSTFGSLREELCHLQDDLEKLETDKMLLEKDLDFKASQVKEYETLLASMRENSHQQQQGLRDSAAKCRSLEEKILALQYAEGENECRIKELEYGKRTLEQEIRNLRMQTCSNPVLQTTTDELSSRYVEMINNLRDDKDREIRKLRSQVNQFQQDSSKREGSNSDFQMRLHALTSKLEEKETFIKQQQEELFQLKQERLACNQLKSTKSIVTKKYSNKYPILGLLSDSFSVTSPLTQTDTIVIEEIEEM